MSLGEARYAIEAASDRLTRTLAAYQIMRHSALPAITPVILEDLCDEVMLAQKLHLASREIRLEVDCQVLMPGRSTVIWSLTCSTTPFRMPVVTRKVSSS